MFRFSHLGGVSVDRVSVFGPPPGGAHPSAIRVSGDLRRRQPGFGTLRIYVRYGVLARLRFIRSYAYTHTNTHPASAPWRATRPEPRSSKRIPAATGPGPHGPGQHRAGQSAWESCELSACAESLRPCPAVGRVATRVLAGAPPRPPRTNLQHQLQLASGGAATLLGGCTAAQRKPPTHVASHLVKLPRATHLHSAGRA